MYPDQDPFFPERLDLDPDPVNIKTDPKLLIMWILNQRPYNEGRLFNCDIGLNQQSRDTLNKNQVRLVLEESNSLYGVCESRYTSLSLDI